MAPIVSADDHIVEHPEVWTARMARSRFGVRIPHIERQADGSDCWMIDGNRLPLLGSGSIGALMPERTGEPRRFEEIPGQAWAPSERLAAMDRDGVDFSVLYPSVAGIAGETFGRLSDPEFELVCVQSYNDYLIDEWAAASPRFVPQCLVPLASVQAAVAEIRRAAARGHKGVIVPPVPDRLREGAPHINEPAYDPLWSVCEELDLPVCFHAGSLPQLEMAPYGLSPRLAEAMRAITRPAGSTSIISNLIVSRILERHPRLKVVFGEATVGLVPYILEVADYAFVQRGLSPRLAEAMRAITRPAGSTSIISNLIVSRILERHPRLKVVFGEATVGLVPYILEVADYAFVQRGLKRQFNYEATLSEFFRRNCYAVSWYDDASLRQTCACVGAKNVLWGSNFPLATSTWPDSQSFAGRCTEKLTAPQRRRVLWENAAELYKLEIRPPTQANRQGG